MLEIERPVKGLDGPGRFILDELVDNGFAVLDEEVYRMAFEDIWSCDDLTRRALGLTVLEGLELEVVVRGALGQPGATFELQLKSPLGRHTEAALDGGMIRVGDDVFLLSASVGKAIDAVRSRPPSPSPEEQYRILSELRDVEQVKLPAAFRKGVEVIEGWSLDAVEREGGIAVDFGTGRNGRGEEVDLTGLGAGLERGNAQSAAPGRMRSSYGLADGSRVFLAEKVKPAAHRVVRERRKILSRRELAAALQADPTLGLDPAIVALDGFSERVAQLGVFVAEPQLIVKGSGVQWVPEIQLAAHGDVPLRFMVSDESDLDELQHAVLEGEAVGDGLVEYKGVFVPIDQARELLELVRNRFKGVISEPKGVLIPIVREEEEPPPTSWEETLGQLQFTAPADLREGIALRDHQQRGVAWLQELAWKRERSGALLADDMGLGKTLQVWSFLSTWRAHGQVGQGPMLIVAPVSLLENWQVEYERFFDGDFDVRMLEARHIEHLDWGGLGPGDVLLINYERLVRAAVPAAQVDWSVVVLDEAQKIKNPSTLVSHVAKSLKARFRVAMTGTPVENSLLDFWNIMDFLLPGMLGTRREFNREYRLSGDAEQKLEAAGRLRAKVGWHMLRRLKEDVARDLPPKTEYPSRWHPRDGMHDWAAEMTKKQHEVYAGIQTYLEKVVERGEENPVTAFLRALEGWRLTVDHPLLAEKIEELLLEESVPSLIAQSAKLTQTVRIVDGVRDRGEKVLVFTNFKMTQRMLRRVFQERYGVRVAIINGDTPASAVHRSLDSRQQVVERFNASEGFSVLVLSPIAAGFGLNIQGANHVVHFTRHWNPAKEAQATDRAYRIGQQLPVSVYYPMSLSSRFSTFDARLHELLASKKALADESLVPSEEVKLADFRMG